MEGSSLGALLRRRSRGVRLTGNAAAESSGCIVLLPTIRQGVHARMRSRRKWGMWVVMTTTPETTVLYTSQWFHVACGEMPNEYTKIMSSSKNYGKSFRGER